MCFLWGTDKPIWLDWVQLSGNLKNRKYCFLDPPPPNFLFFLSWKKHRKIDNVKNCDSYRETPVWISTEILFPLGPFMSRAFPSRIIHWDHFNNDPVVLHYALHKHVMLSKVVLMLNWLSTTPRTRMGKWMSALDGGERLSCMPQSITSYGKRPRQPLDRRQGGPQSQSGRGGEENVLDYTGTRTPNPRSRSP
jgi:hypothetical protein